MRQWTGSASSLDEAVLLGLKALGLRREQVDVEVLEERASGLLSMMGFSRVRIRVSERASGQAGRPSGGDRGGSHEVGRRDYDRHEGRPERRQDEPRRSGDERRQLSERRRAFFSEGNRPEDHRPGPRGEERRPERRDNRRDDGHHDRFGDTLSGNRGIEFRRDEHRRPERPEVRPGEPRHERGPRRDERGPRPPSDRGRDLGRPERPVDPRRSGGRPDRPRDPSRAPIDPSVPLPPLQTPAQTVKPAATPAELLSQWREWLGWQDLQWDVAPAGEGGGPSVKLRTSQAAKLYGPNGSTLESFSHLFNIVLSRADKDAPRVSLELEGFDVPAPRSQDRPARDVPAARPQEERGGLGDEEVISAAQYAASEVRRTGRMFRLDPMNSADRKLAHKTLAGETDIETFSEGEGPWRKVVVRPKQKK